MAKNSPAKKGKAKNTGNAKSKSSIKSEELLRNLKQMLIARSIDNKAMNLLRQGRSFFHIAGAGHEAVQTVVGNALDPKVDWFYPYYRDLACCSCSRSYSKGIFLSMFCKNRRSIEWRKTVTVPLGAS